MRPPTVHPRSRGEHVKFFGSKTKLAGSSPLSRGTHQRGHKGAGIVRFIPALAGNTYPTHTRLSPPQVHPRSRGEHPCGALAATLTDGSSPLSRGTPLLIALKLFGVRFIPALAGNTKLGTPENRARSVHPRSRGEHSYCISLIILTFIRRKNSTDFSLFLCDLSH